MCFGVTARGKLSQTFAYRGNSKNYLVVMLTSLSDATTYNTKTLALIAFHHSKVSAFDKTRIFEMSHFAAYFHFGLALLALSLVNQTTANKPRGNISKGAPTTWNSNNLYFYAGTTQRIEPLLMKMKKQLSQIGSDIKKL